MKPIVYKILNIYSSVLDIKLLPEVIISLEKNVDYCGKLETYGGVPNRHYLTINIPSVYALADTDGISILQAIKETIYHEWIHYVQAITLPSDRRGYYSHSDEIWNNMILIGMFEGFITRGDI